MSQDENKGDLEELFTSLEQKRTLDTEKYNDLIVSEVKRLGCANRVEIALSLGLSPERVYPMIGGLIKDAVLMRRPLPPHAVPKKLRPRIEEFWAMGMTGYEKFNRNFWIEICEPEHEPTPDVIPIKTELIDWDTKQ